MYKTAQGASLKIEVKIEDETVCEILKGKNKVRLFNFYHFLVVFKTFKCIYKTI